MKLSHLILIAIAGVSTSETMAQGRPKNPTAEFNGRKYVRRGGKTYSGGRVVNPRSSNPTAVINGRRYERRNGKTYGGAAGKLNSLFR